MLGILQNLGRSAPAVVSSLAKTGGAKAVGFLDDFIRQQFASAGRRVGSSVRAQANKPGLPGFIGDIRVTAATPVFRGTAGAVGGAYGLGALGVAEKRSGLTGNIENALGQVGPGLDRFFGAVTPRSIQQIGQGMEQYGWGALGGLVPGELKASSTAPPERAKGTQATLNGKPVYWTGSQYGWQSGPSALKAGLLGSEVVGDEAFAGAGGQPPPAPALPPPVFQGGGGQQAGQQTAQPPAFPGSRGMSNGAGVPALRQNVQERALSQEVLNAAQQYSAPSSVSLPSFYQGQQQLGRSMEQTGELQRQLQELGGAAGMSNDALMQWAKANPGLAYRELQKLKSRSSQ
jgi:hypothetical protein